MCSCQIRCIFDLLQISVSQHTWTRPHHIIHCACISVCVVCACTCWANAIFVILMAQQLSGACSGMVRGKGEQENEGKRGGTPGWRGAEWRKENSHFMGYCPSWYDRHQGAQTSALAQEGQASWRIGEREKEKREEHDQAAQRQRLVNSNCGDKPKWRQTGELRETRMTVGSLAQTILYVQ